MQFAHRDRLGARSRSGVWLGAPALTQRTFQHFRYVEFLIPDGERWTELKLERNDRGNSQVPMLDTYLRMLSGSTASWDSRKRGVRRLDNLLSLEELERIADAGPALPPNPKS